MCRYLTREKAFLKRTHTFFVDVSTFILCASLNLLVNGCSLIVSSEMRHGVRGVSQTKQKVYPKAEAQDGSELIHFFISLASTVHVTKTTHSLLAPLKSYTKKNEQWVRKTTTPPICCIFSLSSADRTPLILDIKCLRQRKLILFARKLALGRIECFM